MTSPSRAASFYLVDGGAVNIAVGPNGLPWIVNDQN